MGLFWPWFNRVVFSCFQFRLSKKEMRDVKYQLGPLGLSCTDLFLNLFFIGFVRKCKLTKRKILSDSGIVTAFAL